MNGHFGAKARLQINSFRQIGVSCCELELGMFNMTLCDTFIHNFADAALSLMEDRTSDKHSMCGTSVSAAVPTAGLLL